MTRNHQPMRGEPWLFYVLAVLCCCSAVMCISAPAYCLSFLGFAVICLALGVNDRRWNNSIELN